SLSELPGGERKGRRDAGGLPAAEADVEVDGVASVEGDVFDEEPDHSLAIPLGRGRISPQGGEVAHQGPDLRLVLVVERATGSLAGPVVVVLRVAELSQGVVPVGLERVGHEPVVGVDGEVT